MKTLKKLWVSYFKWWDRHFRTNYDLFLPTGMLPYRFIERNYKK